MAALAFALHILGAVIWVGGMFAIYVCLPPALVTLEPPQRLRLMRVTCVDGSPAAARQRLFDAASSLRRICRRRPARPSHASDRVGHDRLVRVAVPQTVAGIQTRRRRSGLAERRHQPRPHPPDHQHQPAPRPHGRSHRRQWALLGLALSRIALLRSGSVPRIAGEVDRRKCLKSKNENQN
jgi:hypothetical protein